MNSVKKISDFSRRAANKKVARGANLWENRKSNRALEMRPDDSAALSARNKLFELPEVAPLATFWMRFQRENQLRHSFFKDH